MQLEISAELLPRWFCLMNCCFMGSFSIAKQRTSTQTANFLMRKSVICFLTSGHLVYLSFFGRPRLCIWDREYTQQGFVCTHHRLSHPCPIAHTHQCSNATLHPMTNDTYHVSHIISYHIIHGGCWSMKWGSFATMKWGSRRHSIDSAFLRILE